MKIFLSLLMIVCLLAGCGEVGANAPTSASDSTLPPAPEVQLIPQSRKGPDDDNRVYYEIFVRSYCDSNRDGIGDLKGVQSKLDYLEDLGVRGIWLMPVHPSNSYHKYDVKDYYAIDPEYGTMEDFDALVQECDQRGIRVMMDLVLNHTAREHIWFQTASKYLAALPEGAQPDFAACPEAAFYHFEAADSCPQFYHPVPGAKGWYYEGRFSDQMPDLNFDSPQLFEEIEKIMAFWLDKGVDGFRLDAVKEYESGRTDRNIEILSQIKETAKALKPDCYLVCEVWDGFTELARYYESGISSIFNYPFGNSDGKIPKVIRAAGNPGIVSTYAPALQKADSYYRSINPDYIDSPFLSNHDVGRIAGFAGRDLNKTKLAGAMNLFMSGSVFVYYGEELGMVCGALNDPSYRAPMVWTADNHMTPPPGCTLPDSYPCGSLAEQMNDPASIYNYYKAAIAIRNALPVLSRGIPTVETALNKGCISAVRKTWNEEMCIVLMNIDDKAADVDLSEYAQWQLSGSLAVGDEPNVLDGTTLHMPGYGVAVLLPAAQN